MQFDLSAVPFGSVQQLHRDLRKTFFTVPEPASPGWVVDADLDLVEAALGRASFSPNWEQSYNYRGEDLNLARVIHCTAVETRLREQYPGVEWWQDHVRGWGHDTETPRCRLRGHREPEPTEHPRPHLRGDGAYDLRDRSSVAAVLDGEGWIHEFYRTLPVPTE